MTEQTNNVDSTPLGAGGKPIIAITMGDPASIGPEIAIKALLQKRQVFNAGCGQEYSIAQVVQTIQTLMSTQARVVADPERVRPERSEVMRLVSDSSKLRHVTGWESHYTLEMGLKNTIDWFTHPDRISVARARRYGV